MGKQRGNGDGAHNDTEIENEPYTQSPSIDRSLHLFDSRLFVPEL